MNITSRGIVSDMIKCKVCGREYKSLARHIGKHGLNKKTYQELYPGEIIQVLTKDHKEKIKSSHWSTREATETENIRKKISENGARVMKRLNDEGKAFRMEKGFWSEDHKSYMRTIMKGRNFSEETIVLMKLHHWTKKSPSEVLETLRKIQHNDRGCKSYFHSNKSGETYFCASSLERKRMENLELDEKVESFTNKHGILIQYEYEGKLRRYIPDILVIYSDGKKVIEEVKGFVYEKLKVEAKRIAAEAFASENGMEYKIVYEP